MTPTHADKAKDTFNPHTSFENKAISKMFDPSGSTSVTELKTLKSARETDKTNYML